MRQCEYARSEFALLGAASADALLSLIESPRGVLYMRSIFSPKNGGAEHIDLPVLGWTFLRLGSVAFGGLGATLALLQRELVDRRQWFHERDISEALAVTQALPGSTGIQVVAYLGWRLRGWPGALMAAMAFIAPAAALMIVVAAGSLALPDRPWVRGALTGVQVGVVGLVTAAMWRLARSNAKSAMLTMVLLASCVLGFFVHALMIVVGAGLIGAVFAAERGDG